MASDDMAQQPGMRHLFGSFWSEVSEQFREAGLSNVTCSMELNMTTQAEPRLHLHAFATATKGRMRLSRTLRMIVFAGRAADHIAPCCPGSGRNCSAKAVNMGHYYLQAEKIGSVFRRANYVKGKHFGVKWNMIKNLWSMKKMTHDAARREVAAARDRVGAALRDIRDAEQAESAQVVSVRATAARVQTSMRPFQPLSRGMLNLLSQFASDAGSAASSRTRRFKALVLDGPSRTGKTERCLSFFGTDATLVVNCQTAAEPNLHAWLGGQFSSILMEETGWRLLWMNRQLFQSGPHCILLGQSQCQEHAYSVFLHGTPLMLTSNDFWTDCSSFEARQWIEANIVYERVEHALWIA